MPWHIEKKGDRHCVVEGESGPGKTVKCHGSKDEALAHLRALYANVPEARPHAATAAEFGLEMALVAEAFDAAHPWSIGAVQLEPAGVALKVAVAASAEQKARGMTGRSFEGFEAMLFAYEQDVEHAFHMQGVTTDLVIAWYDAEGELVDCAQLEAGSSEIARAPRPWRYALELPAAAGVELEGQSLNVAFTLHPE